MLIFRKNKLRKKREATYFICKTINQVYIFHFLTDSRINGILNMNNVQTTKMPHILHISKDTQKAALEKMISTKLNQYKQVVFSIHFPLKTFYMLRIHYYFHISYLFLMEKLQKNIWADWSRQSRGELSISSNLAQQEQECMFISQYLEFRKEQSNAEDKQMVIQNKEFDKNFQKGTSSQNQQVSEQQVRKQSKNSSCFHNFQKHLITTLKNSIKIKKSNYSSHSKSRIANELWQYFIDTSKGGKRAIFSLLTYTSANDETLKKEKKYYKEYENMLHFFSDYSQREINEAQLLLSREVVRQSRRLLQSNSLEKRRINKPEEFKKYFENFLYQLENGRVSLRLPKKSIISSQSSSQQAIQYTQTRLTQ